MNECKQAAWGGIVVKADALGQRKERKKKRKRKICHDSESTVTNYRPRSSTPCLLRELRVSAWENEYDSIAGCGGILRNPDSEPESDITFPTATSCRRQRPGVSATTGRNVNIFSSGVSRVQRPLLLTACGRVKSYGLTSCVLVHLNNFTQFLRNNKCVA